MGQMLTGLSITSAPMRVEWTPSLHRAAMSGGESRPVAARPSPSRAVPSQLVASMVAAAEAASVVTLVAPAPPATVKEERETGLPASPGAWPHGSHSRSELEVPGEDTAGPEPEHLPVAREIEVVEIPSNGEAGDKVEPPAPS